MRSLFDDNLRGRPLRHRSPQNPEFLQPEDRTVQHPDREEPVTDRSSLPGVGPKSLGGAVPEVRNFPGDDVGECQVGQRQGSEDGDLCLQTVRGHMERRSAAAESETRTLDSDCGVSRNSWVLFKRPGITLDDDGRTGP